MGGDLGMMDSEGKKALRGKTKQLAAMHPKQNQGAAEHDAGIQKKLAPIALDAQAKEKDVRYHRTGHQPHGEQGSQGRRSGNQNQHRCRDFQDARTNAAPGFHAQGGKYVNGFRRSAKLKEQGLQQDECREPAQYPGKGGFGKCHGRFFW